MNFGEVNTNGADDQSSYYLGGISGDNPYTIQNCYNYGKIGNHKYSGGIAGGNCSSKVSNCYYLKGSAIGGICENDVEGKAEPLELSEMPKAIDVLLTDNEQIEYQGNLVNVWKEDTNNINNGYPILYWQE